MYKNIYMYMYIYMNVGMNTCRKTYSKMLRIFSFRSEIQRNRICFSAIVIAKQTNRFFASFRLILPSAF